MSVSSFDSFIIDATVYRWLAPGDSSVNYHAAREMHHAQTGAWFIHGEQFVNWQQTPDSALWIYGTREFVVLQSKRCKFHYLHVICGAAGCGKTVIW